jgi:tetratricopeptide (TPR) repeat protein
MSRVIRLSACTLFLGVSLSAWTASGTPTRLGSDTEAPPQRLALLVGNSKYEHLNPLKNPKNDVDQLAAKLKQLGFQNSIAYDLNHDDFVDTLSTFQNKIAPGDIALFYYSGHGVQLGGTNYLIPVSMQSGASPVTLQGSGIPLTLVRNALSSAKVGLIILDACRTVLNLPAKGPLDGLAGSFPRGALVAYAADEGQSASDNDTEELSLFTKYLISEMDRPDETLCQLFGGVREAVDVASQHVQFPFVYDGVIGDFVFNRTTTEESRKLSAVSNTVGRTKVWTTIEVSDNPNDFAAFLAPGLSEKKHVKAAEDRLSSLMSSTAKAVGLVPLDAQGVSPEIVAMGNQGERLFYEKAYTKALKSYEKLLALRPSDGSILYDYATCLLHLGRNDEAIQFFSKAVEVNPEFPWAYFNRGVAHHLKGDLAQAIEDYTSTLKRRTSYALGYNNLALAKRDAGDLAGAEQDVEKAIALDSNYAPAFFNGAEISMDIGHGGTAWALKDKGKRLLVAPPAQF